MQQTTNPSRLSTDTTANNKGANAMNQVVYSSKSTAARAAKRRGLKKPEYIDLPDGRVAVREKGTALYDASQRIKSEVKNPVKLVWDLCFDHPKAKRRDIVDMAIEKGVAVNTARTQYQAWRAAEGLSKARGKHVHA